MRLIGTEWADVIPTYLTRRNVRQVMQNQERPDEVNP